MKKFHIAVIILCTLILFSIIFTVTSLKVKNLTRLQLDNRISLVVSWIDGADEHFYSTRKTYVDKEHVPKNSHNIADYRVINTDELKYLLRSVDKFGPWIYKIFIVTSFHQRPKWLQTSSRIKLVNDTEIVPAQYLPTFNSHVIECYLHKIAGLTEHYIYANDDMFLGRNVTAADFFENGKPIIYAHGIQKPTEDEKSYHKMAWFNNYKLLADMHGHDALLPEKLPCHQMIPTTKTIAQKMHDLFPEQITQTAQTKFRNANNIHPLGLQLYNALCEGTAVLNREHMDELYSDFFSDAKTFKYFLDYITMKKPKFFCVNNIIAPSPVFIEFAEHYFPEKSQFEKILQ